MGEAAITPTPGRADGQDTMRQDVGGEDADASNASSPANDRVSPEDVPDVPDTVTQTIFDAFFRHIHHIPGLSFLHRASLMERYHAGLLNRSLFLAMIGITTLLRDLRPGLEDYGSRCIDEAESLVMHEFQKPSIINLQALVIVIKYHLLARRFPRAFMLNAVASRFATALRLTHENANLCFLARESRRRLMWSVWMIDAGIASGQLDFSLWPDAERWIHIQLPCNERNFEFDLAEPTEHLRPPDAPAMLPENFGFMALHVRVFWIRTRLLQWALSAASGESGPAGTSAAAGRSADALAALPATWEAFKAELDAFAARLPASFRWSEANVRLRTYSPRLCVFVMTHVWWRTCQLEVGRLFLPGLKEALPPAARARLDPGLVARERRACYEHAKRLADMFALLLGLDAGVPVTDLDLPVCAFHCARVLYHGLQTAAGKGLGLTEDRVKELAAVCLAAARQATRGPACESVVSLPGAGGTHLYVV